jgi:hypothetical protein
MVKEGEKRVPKVKRVNRSEAANQVLSEFNGRATLTELAEKANQLVVASGGTSNPKDTAHYLRRSLATAEALGLVKITRPTDWVVEKLKAAK